MGREELSIHLDSEVLEAVHVAAAAAGTSVPAWVAETVEERIRRRYLRQALDAVRTETGPMDDEEIARLVVEARRGSRPVGPAGGA